MILTINGEDKSIDSSYITVTELLDKLSISVNSIAVELNRSIIPKGQFDSTSLANGDKLEIVQFVGGG